ncbi:MAG TPA: hypothetical protein VMY77_07690 [Chitinophagaceae bacterium]|nr:hypothetical protein [Chitinophagaceae bacterium]
MNKLLRALIAGYGAKKLGGGCLSTVLIFLLIYWALGNCNSSNRTAPARPASLIQERKVAVNPGNNNNRIGSVYYLASHLHTTVTLAVNR